MDFFLLTLHNCTFQCLSQIAQIYTNHYRKKHSVYKNRIIYIMYRLTYMQIVYQRKEDQKE